MNDSDNSRSDSRSRDKSDCLLADQPVTDGEAVGSNPAVVERRTRHKIESEFLRLALIGGFIDADSVADWADEMMMGGGDVSLLADLSLSSVQPPSEVERLLSEIPGECGSDIPIQVLLAYCQRLDQENAMSTAEIVSRMKNVAMAYQVPETFQHDIDWLDERIYLASAGEYGTVNDAHKGARCYFARFSQYKCFIPQSLLRKELAT